MLQIIDHEITKYRGLTGVYALVCRTTKHAYIGSSKSLYGRLIGHRSSLRKGKHHCKHLLHAWQKYGEADFDLVIVEVCEFSICREREQYWIDMHGHSNVLNDLKRVGSYLKVRCERISRALTGRTFSDETRQKMSKAKKGKKRAPHSEETKMKIRAQRWHHSEETLQKLRGRVSPMKGKSPTKEHRDKLSKANTGKRHSELSKLKMSLAKRGRPGHLQSQETRAKISQTRRAHLTGNLLLMPKAKRMDGVPEGSYL